MSKMSTWFKEFPRTLKNGAEKIRDAGSLPRPHCSTGSKSRKNSCESGGGAGSLLSGKARKNSGTNGLSSHKTGTVWDSLLSGRSRRTPKPASEEQQRPLRAPTAACASISRMIRVDKLGKSANLKTGATCGPGAHQEEKTSQIKTEALIIMEDYADPFDAQNSREQRDVRQLGENGYMEPYDAQQMITEIRRRGSKDLLKASASSNVSEGVTDEAPMQIYDVPYDGGVGDRALRLEPDRRPATEYELPWEWKKRHIVRTLSAQFDSPVKVEASHPLLTRQTQQQHQKQRSRTLKVLKSSPPSLLRSSAPGGPQEPCSVDPCLPLEKQSWFHGCVSRQEAEFQLQACREASFLVRNSESSSSKYSIALKTSQGCVHIIVAQTKESGFTLDQSSCVFPSIPEVVHHYCSQRLPFNGAEHMTLLHPVPRIL